MIKKRTTKRFLGSFLFIPVFLFSSLALAELTPLPVEKIFKLVVAVNDPNTLNLNFEIEPNHYLYQKRLHFKLEGGTVGPVRYPPPTVFKDSSGKAYDVYQDSLKLNLPLLFDKQGETTLLVSYQGCSANGFCYPPQTKAYKLYIDEHLGLYKATLKEKILTKQSNFFQVDNKLESSFFGKTPILILFSAYFLGLLLSFTPCVLPMLPILSGIIVGQKKALTKKKSFCLALSYVLSMSITYAFIGLIIALTGKNLQLLLQTPLIIILFSLIFVLLALSLFGFYELKLPEQWLNKFSKLSNSQEKGAYLSAILMGALATLILTPCVTAPLVGLLGFIAQTGNVTVGALGLFLLSLGMGTPLLILSIGAGSLLPKAGQWMNEVKTFFAIAMLALAIYTLSSLLSPSTPLYLYGGLLISYGFSFYPFARNKDKSSLLKSSGFICLLYGSLLIIGAAKGNSSLFAPLKETSFTTFSQERLSAKPVYTLMDLNEKLQQSTKPSIVLFSANWCTSCHILKKQVLSNPKTQPILSHFNYLEVDLTRPTKGNQQIMKYFQVVAPPTILFFNNLNQLREDRIVGEISGDAFRKKLEKVLTDIGKA